MSDDADVDASADPDPPRREVTHEATGPLKLDGSDVDPEKGDIAVCLCGLSDGWPFCDGSHDDTAGEESGGHYKYVDGERREIAGIRYADGDPADGDDPGGAGNETGDANG